MGNVKMFKKFISLSFAALLLASVGALPAKANVDIWNEDGVAYQVVVIGASSQDSLSIGAGKSRKSICENCIVKISPLTGESWSDQIEASGQDVITIENGSLRIGEGSRN